MTIIELVIMICGIFYVSQTIYGHIESRKHAKMHEEMLNLQKNRENIFATSSSVKSCTDAIDKLMDAIDRLWIDYKSFKSKFPNNSTEAPTQEN